MIEIDVRTNSYGAAAGQGRLISMFAYKARFKRSPWEDGMGLPDGNVPDTIAYGASVDEAVCELVEREHRVSLTKLEPLADFI